MRLFKAQNFYGDTTAPAPPPPFSIDREATRVMPVYLNQYRDGRRLPTPEKVAVMELSNSFERRRLGKHQRILNDISERCRAQEINDLSNKLSAKMNLRKIDKPRELTFFTAALTRDPKPSLEHNPLLEPKPKPVVEAIPIVESKPPPKPWVDSSKPPPSNTIDPERNELDVSPGSDDSSATKIYEKNYRQFPARRIMRQQSKFEFLRQSTFLPRLGGSVEPSQPAAGSPDLTMRNKLAQNRQINGTIQLDHYVSPRPDLAPLILPTLEQRYSIGGPLSERFERQDTCFSTSRLVLGPRTRTTIIDSARLSTDKTNTHPKPPLTLAGYGHELSQLQLTSGHSPPPNSEHEVEAAA